MRVNFQHVALRKEDPKYLQACIGAKVLELLNIDNRNMDRAKQGLENLMFKARPLSITRAIFHWPASNEFCHVECEDKTQALLARQYLSHKRVGRKNMVVRDVRKLKAGVDRAAVPTTMSANTATASNSHAIKTNHEDPAHSTPVYFHGEKPGQHSKETQNTTANGTSQVNSKTTRRSHAWSRRTKTVPRTLSPLNKLFLDSIRGVTYLPDYLDGPARDQATSTQASGPRAVRPQTIHRQVIRPQGDIKYYRQGSDVEPANVLVKESTFTQANSEQLRTQQVGASTPHAPKSEIQSEHPLPTQAHARASPDEAYTLRPSWQTFESQYSWTHPTAQEREILLRRNQVVITGSHRYEGDEQLVEYGKTIG